MVLFEEDDPLNTVCSGKKRGHMLLSKSKKFSVCDGTGWHSLTSGKPTKIVNLRTRMPLDRNFDPWITVRFDVKNKIYFS